MPCECCGAGQVLVVLRGPGPAVAARAAVQASASARGTKRMRPLLSTIRAEGLRLGRLLSGGGGGGVVRRELPRWRVLDPGVCRGAGVAICHLLQLQVVVLVLFLFALAGRLLAGSVLGAALVRVTRSSSAGCCGKARPAPCQVVDAETTDRVRVQGLLA
jgi:hypothetical protein